MSNNLMRILRDKARSHHRRIVLPEGDDPTIVEAARRIAADGIAQPILIRTATAGGPPADCAGIAIIDPKTSSKRGEYAQLYAIKRQLPRTPTARLLAKPVNFAAAMVGAGDADGLVAGFTCGTPAVIIASQMFIGLRAGVETTSSFFLMAIPDWTGGEDGHLLFADCSINRNPSPAELADIAITTATSASQILGWEPRVALLSFSTKGSASHPDVDKVAAAVRLARARRPDLAIDGEMQADAAIMPAVAAKKLVETGPVAGRANILVFPDLDAGNIAYKLVQRLAGAAAYGPLFQGFRSPVSDISKGASLDEIIGAAVMVAASDLS